VTRKLGEKSSILSDESHQQNVILTAPLID